MSKEAKRRHHKLEYLLACLSAMAILSIAWSVTRSTERAEITPPAQDNILRSTQKPKVPISDNSSRSNFSAVEINRSMRARRDQAWMIVQQAWAPVSVAGSKIPAWMTWYEEEDVARLYRELLNRQNATRGDLDAAVDAVLNARPYKDLQGSLTSARLGKVLRQFTFPNIPPLGPNRKPATGVIYYNTAYVRHLLKNAEQISRCD